MRHSARVGYRVSIGFEKEAQGIEHLIPSWWHCLWKGNGAFTEALKIHNLTPFPVRSLCFTLMAEDVMAQVPSPATMPTTCIDTSPL